LQVRTDAGAGQVHIHVGLDDVGAALAGLDAALAVDPRLDTVRRRVDELGGQLVVAEGRLRISLPALPPDA
jgi:hypothetical protein